MWVRLYVRGLIQTMVPSVDFCRSLESCLDFSSRIEFGGGRRGGGETRAPFSKQRLVIEPTVCTDFRGISKQLFHSENVSNVFRPQLAWEIWERSNRWSFCICIWGKVGQWSHAIVLTWGRVFGIKNKRWQIKKNKQTFGSWNLCTFLLMMINEKDWKFCP